MLWLVAIVVAGAVGAALHAAGVDSDIVWIIRSIIRVLVGGLG